MADTLASLVVNMQVQTAELRKGLDEANAKLNGFAKQAESAGRAISQVLNVAALKKAFDAVSGLVTTGAQAADAMGKMAQAAGVTTEEFSRMNYAAGLSGVSAQDLSGAFAKLNKGISEASTGNKSASDLFRALGVSVKDASGAVRKSDEVMKDVAATFALMDNGANKSALAMELFGKSGAQLIPMLNLGASGIAQLSEEADKLGLTVGGSAAASAEKFNDNITRLQRASEGLGLKIAEALTPALSELTDQMVESAKESGGLVNMVKTMAGWAIDAGFAFNKLAVHIAGVAQAFANIGESWAVRQEGARAYAEELDRVAKKHDAAKKAFIGGGADGAAAEPELFSLVDGQRLKEANQAAQRRAALAKAVTDAQLTEKLRLQLELDITAELERAQFSFAKENTSALEFQRPRWMDEYDRAMNDNLRLQKQETDALIQAATAGDAYAGRLAEMAGAADELRAALDSSAEAARQDAMAREQAQQQAVAGVAQSVGMTLAGPRLGGIINAGVQGAAAGPIGAAAAAGAALIAQSKQFAAIQESLDNVLQGLADGLGELLEPVGKLLEPLEPLGLVFGVVAKIMAEAMRPGIELMAQVLKVVSSILLTVYASIGKVWNSIIGAIQSVLSNISKFEIAGQKPFKFLDDWGKSLERSKINVIALEDAQKALWEEHKEVVKTVAPPAGEASKALDAMAKTTKDATETFNESLTNMVSGYKLAGPRFDSSVGLITLNAKQQPAPTVNVYVDGQQVEPDRVEVERPTATVQPLLIAQYG